MKIQFSVVLCAIFLVSAYASADAGQRKNRGASQHLQSLDCTENQIAKYDGTRWICADEASGSCAVSADLGITTIACADGSSASIPPILAVAFTNDDGQPGYLAGVDTLIAGLFDANFDGVPSVGDIVKLDQYPLDLDAVGRGEFLTKTHVVTSPCPSSTCPGVSV